MRSLFYAYWPNRDGDLPPRRKPIGKYYEIAVPPKISKKVIGDREIREETFLDLSIQERLDKIYNRLTKLKIKFKRATPNRYKQCRSSIKNKSSNDENNKPTEFFVGTKKIYDNKEIDLPQYQIVFDGDTVTGDLESIRWFAIRNMLPINNIKPVIPQNLQLEDNS